MRLTSTSARCEEYSAYTYILYLLADRYGNYMRVKRYAFTSSAGNLKRGEILDARVDGNTPFAMRAPCETRLCL